MTELLDRYLSDAEMYRWTPSTFLKRRGIDYARYHGALYEEIEQALIAKRVVAISSKAGSISYIEVIE